MEAIDQTLGTAVVDTRWFFFVYAAVTVGISVGVFTRIEEPARRWLKRRL
jgi:peptidoglycan/LPS O-acetylase OafA/YrhL